MSHTHTSRTYFLIYRELFIKFGMNDDDVVSLREMWNESHRHYHSYTHLRNILKLIEKDELSYYDEIGESKPVSNRSPKYCQMWDLLKIIAFFHDAIYQTPATISKMFMMKPETFMTLIAWNEIASAELAIKMCKNFTKEQKKLVFDAIIDTADHSKKPSSFISAIFLEYDLWNLTHGTLSTMIEDEKKIFKEFGFVDFSIYKEKRVKILAKFGDYIRKKNPETMFDAYLDWCKSNVPNIAIYP